MPVIERESSLLCQLRFIKPVFLVLPVSVMSVGYLSNDESLLGAHETGRRTPGRPLRGDLLAVNGRGQEEWERPGVLSCRGWVGSGLC